MAETILLTEGSSQYSFTIFTNSSLLYLLTTSAAVIQVVLSNLISSGPSNLKLNHLSASSTCKEDNHKS
jgi:hypothetical protein